MQHVGQAKRAVHRARDVGERFATAALALALLVQPRVLDDRRDLLREQLDRAHARRGGGPGSSASPSTSVATVVPPTVRTGTISSFEFRNTELLIHATTDASRASCSASTVSTRP